MKINKFVTTFERVISNKGIYVKESISRLDKCRYRWSTWTNNRIRKVQYWDNEDTSSFRLQRERNKLGKLNGFLSPKLREVPDGNDNVVYLDDFPFEYDARRAIKREPKKGREIFDKCLDTLMKIHERDVLHGNACLKNFYQDRDDFKMFDFSTVLEVRGQHDMMRAYDVLTLILNTKRDGTFELFNDLMRGLPNRVPEKVANKVKEIAKEVSYPRILIARRLSLADFTQFKINYA
tara:strand:+ start:6194 stop:6901 length:708 start_codon:yes stop_codon:yes gene_type:complete